MNASSRMNDMYNSLHPCDFLLHRGSSTHPLTRTRAWAAIMTPKNLVANDSILPILEDSYISRASSIIRIIAPYQTLAEFNPLFVLSIRSSTRSLLRCLYVLEGFSPIRPS